ncbi:hypothetical protein [Actinoplanes teichomyceticus]|uniref:Uncharacterized protein n=1 Tax=Actinoplanes teichomyceticus TaxID=1867 RepID=A0A561VIE0_ACTTI|nr:hypothetical protein [Actinoplanes teichomyceticus]TWG11388.1 hypothetical protein FHX34_106118 [Actinoplanes teichomyceticus]GIF15798.1 hypothetical protein Ate01nite_58300 [Actinoplanes teichomyceticus]
MRDHIFRTTVLAAWLLALLLHAPSGPRTGLLTVAVVLVWAAPLVRDHLAHRQPRSPARMRRVHVSRQA